MMDKNTQLISVERDELDADCLVVSLKVNVGMLNGTATSKVASQNRMAGERLFQWLSERVPPSVFDGFMAAAGRRMDTANGPSEIRAASSEGPTVRNS